MEHKTDPKSKEKNELNNLQSKVPELTENIKNVKIKNFMNSTQKHDKFFIKFKKNTSKTNEDMKEIDSIGYKTNYFSWNLPEKDSKFNTKTNFFKQKFNQTAYNETSSNYMSQNKNHFLKTSSSGFESNQMSRPKTVYKENDLSSLFSLYHMNNQLLSENNNAIRVLINKSEKQELYEKFEIQKGKEFKKEIETVKSTIKSKNKKLTSLDKLVEKFNKHQTRCPESFFNDPTNSLKKLKLNNQIFQRVMSSREHQQCESYDNKIREDFHKFMILLHMNKVKESDKIRKNQNKTSELDENSNQYIPKNQWKKQESLGYKVSRKYLLENIVLNNYVKEVKSKPKTRSQFTLNLVDDKIYLFGGLSSDKLCDFWICNIKDNYRWQQIYYNEDSEPVPRYGHTSVLYKKELYIYGGSMPSKYFKPSEDLIIFNTSSNFFYEPKTLNKNLAPLRRNHIAIGVGYHMFVHGGIGLYERVLSDSLVFDMPNRRWGVLEIEGKNPPPLAYHSVELVLSIDKLNNPNLNLFNIPDPPIQFRTTSKIKIEGIYVFGGIDNERNYSNDLRILLVGRKPLKWVYPEIEGIPPIARINATMNFFPDIGIMILYGGRNDKRDYIFNDIFILDLYNLVWIKTKTDPIIDTRTEHSSVIYYDKLIILGGNDASKYKKFDLVLIDLDLYNYKRALEKNLERATRSMRNSILKLNEKSKIEFL